MRGDRDCRGVRARDCRRAGARDDRATTLLLYPAAFMVIVVLSAIAVDLSTVPLARREVLRAASQAADDGAAMLDDEAVRRGDFTVIDLDRATAVVRAEMAAQRLPGDLVGPPTVEPGPRPTTISVTATIRVDHLFAAAIPGAPDSETITVEVIGEVIGQ